MKKSIAAVTLAMGLWAGTAMAQPAPPSAQAGLREPPPQAYADCAGKKSGDTVEHTTREGKVPATCMDSPRGLVARPTRQAGDRPDLPLPQDAPARGRKPQGSAQRYSIEQAVSDQAQLHTIAFSGLAFITGDFGASTFIPPGKVADFFGFQYMRDIDAAGKGHNPLFLTRIAANVLHLLNPEQRGLMEKSARQEALSLRRLAEMRLPLIRAFHRELDGQRPPGSRGLNPEAVRRYVGDIFALDAEVSLRRAKVFGRLAASLTPDQKARLARMKFGDFNTWPDVDVEAYKLPRGTEKLVNVAYMTHASEFFSWTAGSAEADAYFCPERHGTYFGGFYMKDMPAMGKGDYDISTSMTGDRGRDFLEALTADQRQHVSGLLEAQRKALQEIVSLRRAMAAELRKSLAGGSADGEKVIALGYRYGELDGEISCAYATAFAKVKRTLTDSQRRALVRLRGLEGDAGPPAYLYSAPLKGEVQLPATDRFFLPDASTAGKAT
jgi:hypothetical protein